MCAPNENEWNSTSVGLLLQHCSIVAMLKYKALKVLKIVYLEASSRKKRIHLL